MPISTLATELKNDAARAVPPPDADSVKTAVRLGSAARPLLLSEIAAHGATSFLALEALRHADPPGYDSLAAEERTKIYVAALKHTSFFNTWGAPGQQLSATALALIGLGPVAVAALTPLLSDRRPAPLSGSKEATFSAMYENRVCDYAWVFISEIKRRPYVYAEKPVERDRAIETLLRELQAAAQTSRREPHSNK